MADQTGNEYFLQIISLIREAGEKNDSFRNEMMVFRAEVKGALERQSERHDNMVAEVAKGGRAIEALERRIDGLERVSISVAEFKALEKRLESLEKEGIKKVGFRDQIKYITWAVLALSSVLGLFWGLFEFLSK